MYESITGQFLGLWGTQTSYLKRAMYSSFQSPCCSFDPVYLKDRETSVIKHLYNPILSQKGTYVRTYIRMYVVHACICTYVCSYVCTYVHTNIYTYVRTYVHTLCMYIMCTYICTYVRMCICMYIKMYTPTFSRTSVIQHLYNTRFS